MKNFLLGKFLTHPSRLVFKAGQEVPAIVPLAAGEIPQELHPYLKDIEDAKNDPGKMKEIVSAALQELAAKHVDKLDKSAQAQKDALKALVEKACESKDPLDRDRLVKDLDVELKGLYAQIDEAAADAKDLLGERRNDAAYYTQEVDALNYQVPINTPYKEAYGAYAKAKGDYLGARVKYGVDAKDPTLDNILIVLGKKAEGDPAKIKTVVVDAEAAVAEIKKLGEKMYLKKEEFTATIDKWEEESVTGVKEGFKKYTVDASDLLDNLSARKKGYKESERIEKKEKRTAKKTELKEKEVAPALQIARAEEATLAMELKDLGDRIKFKRQNLYSPDVEKINTERAVAAGLSASDVHDNMYYNLNTLRIEYQNKARELEDKKAEVDQLFRGKKVEKKAEPEKVGDVVTYLIKPGDNMIKIANKYFGTKDMDFALKLQKECFGEVEYLKGKKLSLIRAGKTITIPAKFEGRDRLINTNQ